MGSKEDQSKVGIPERPRGQQTGREGNPSKNLEEMDDTPALRGERPQANEFFADDSMQHVGNDAATPRSNTPSTPAAVPTGERMGQSGGEQAFKERHSKK